MIDGRRVVLIVKREWLSRVRERSFRLATIFQIVLTLIAACLPTIISRFQNDTPDQVNLGVINDAGIDLATQFQPYFTSTAAGATSFTLTPVNASPNDAADQLDHSDLDALLVIQRNADNSLAFTYYNDSDQLDSVGQQVFVAASALSGADRLQQLGVTPDQFAAALQPPAFNIGSTGGDNDETQGVRTAIAFVSAIVMFIAIQLYGVWIAQGVVEEKSSRIMEIMINAATPRDLLAGKIIGIGCAALTQLVPMLILGGAAFALQPRLADRLNVSTTSTFSQIDFGSISVKLVVYFLVYFLIGFILFASLYAAIGSLLSRQEDVSSAVAPLTMILLVGYFGAIFTQSNPDSNVSRIFSIVPFTAPFNMVGRTLTTDVPAWELVLSIALLVITAVGGVLLAGRVYRIGVLMYGQKPNLRQILLHGGQTTAR